MRLWSGKEISHMASKRSETLNMRIDPKLKYLADIASRETGRTLSGFIERAIKRALAVGAPLEDELRVSAPTGPATEPQLWFEMLWDVDESDRFFKLATLKPGLLTIPEQRLWKLFTMHMNHTRTKITAASFREFWNDPAINTSHLQDGE
jgi:hypothetical protein